MGPRPFRVPAVARSAHMAQEPVQAGRLRRNESRHQLAGRAGAREERGRSAIRRRDATGAAGTGGDWRREVFRPSQAHRSGGCMAHHGSRRISVGGATTEAAARTQTCQRAPHRPLAERTDAKSAGTRNGRARTQSGDCGAARDVSVTALSRADVPLGRCGKHADRHTRTQRPPHTHRTPTHHTAPAQGTAANTLITQGERQ